MSEEQVRDILVNEKKNIANGNFKPILKLIESQLDSQDPTTLLFLITVADYAKQANRNDIAYRIYSKVYYKLSSDRMLGKDHEDVIKIRYNMGMVTNSISETYKCLSESYDSSIQNKYSDLSEKIHESLIAFVDNLPAAHKKLYKKLLSKKLPVKTLSTKPIKKSKQHLSEEELNNLMEKYDLN